MGAIKRPVVLDGPFSATLPRTRLADFGGPTSYTAVDHSTPDAAQRNLGLPVTPTPGSGERRTTTVCA
jgi:hypothetical protein